MDGLDQGRIRIIDARYELSSERLLVNYHVFSRPDPGTLFANKDTLHCAVLQRLPIAKSYST